MRAALPGKPVPATQAVCTGHWDGKRYIIYITGSTLIILTGQHVLLQVIYDESEIQLGAVVFDETTGKIAVSTDHTIRTYRPCGLDENDLKWSLQDTFTVDWSVSSFSRMILSWGVAEELLVGGTHLELFTTLCTPSSIWKSDLANRVKLAELSYDSAFIASTGVYDRFVKIWKRLSFGCDDTRFDFSYLSHPATVTNIYWRKPHFIGQSIENVLYTTCADQILRIWVAPDLHDHFPGHLQLWGQIDLIESIKPRALSKNTSNRFAFIIDCRDFTLATEQAVQSRMMEEPAENHALSHLIEVANRIPEICVVLDDQGHMSAWGLECISYKTLQKTCIFNVAHVDGLQLGLPDISEVNMTPVRFYNYCKQPESVLSIMIHHFDGSLEVFESSVVDFFDPSPRSSRLVSKIKLTGHSEIIKNVILDVNKSVIASQDECNEIIVWKSSGPQEAESLKFQSSFTQTEKIIGICLISSGKFIILLLQDKILLLDARASQGKIISSFSYSDGGDDLCITLLFEDTENLVAYVAILSSKMEGVILEVRLSGMDELGDICGNGANIRKLCLLGSIHVCELSLIALTEPLYVYQIICGASTPAREVAVSLTKSGVLQLWAVRLNLVKNSADWLQTYSIDTGMCDPSLVSVSSNYKAAIVDSNRSELKVWDVPGDCLEFVQNYESHETIQYLDWSSTLDSQSILAVGLSSRVVILVQTRYDYLSKNEAWVNIKEFSIRDLTPHNISNSTWLNSGNLVATAGSQIFIFDTKFKLSTTVLQDFGLAYLGPVWHASELVAQLNSPLPAYHPQFLYQCILSNKYTLFRRLILELYITLKYYIEGESLCKYLGIDTSEFYTTNVRHTTTSNPTKSKEYYSFLDNDDLPETLNEDIASFISEKLSRILLPGLSKIEQTKLIELVKCAVIIEQKRPSIDDNAFKYLFFFQKNALCQGEGSQLCLSWREINWAYHSKSQEIMIDMVSCHSRGKLIWEHARESGMFMWIKDLGTLRVQFENIAKNEYTKTSMKNPIDCALFYLALRKKSVLQGLWRIASWNPEQAATIKLLGNNFNDKKWKTIALKNAYALLGKHRYEYSAAFFLLADCLKDAINVLSTQLNDLQLAVAVARVYEGDGGPILNQFLEDRVVPLGLQNGDRWIVSWALELLGRRSDSLQALMLPTYTLLDSPQQLDPQARSFLKHDPAILSFYAYLRQEFMRATKIEGSGVSSKMEWNFVLRSARQFTRMGSGLLALDLLRNWEFHDPSTKFYHNTQNLPRQSTSTKHDTSTTLDTPVLQKLSDNMVSQKAPTIPVFREPDVSSLLDNFGF
ncbi:unnamed protein product [Blumeria hordei]|uniref:RAVE complex protein Rav1 C-terminal domain-containing protein n=1 Tax=Blumeria hordei TaxID=2867405 RepID=A0A383UYX5_BLUHO|nr:unnamed protein product [Blumeria hordei]